MTTDNAVVAASVQVPGTPRRSAYPWIVFALAFGLLLSDYMSRQVLSAVFPLLKQEWALSDTQLGSLTSIVTLTVGVLALLLCRQLPNHNQPRRIVLVVAGQYHYVTARQRFYTT